MEHELWEKNDPEMIYPTLGTRLALRFFTACAAKTHLGMLCLGLVT